MVIINIYAPNNRVPKYMYQKLTELKRDIDNSTIIGGNFNNSFSITDKTTGR